MAKLGSTLWWVVSVRAQNMAVRAPRLALAKPPIADANAIKSAIKYSHWIEAKPSGECLQH